MRIGINKILWSTTAKKLESSTKFPSSVIHILKEALGLRIIRSRK